MPAGVTREQRAGAARPDRRPQPTATCERHAGNSELEARIRSYELAFRMQTAAPEAFDLTQRDRRRPRRSTASTTRRPPSSARMCLLARRLVERGVRFVQLRSGGWDAHGNLIAQPRAAGEEDRPAHRRPAARPEAARPARADAGDLGRRVRPHADRGEPRPDAGPQPFAVGLLDVAGRRRRQGRPGHRRAPTPSATPPSSGRSIPTTCTPPSCTPSASTSIGWSIGTTTATRW